MTNEILIPQSEIAYNQANGYTFKTSDFTRFFKNGIAENIKAEKIYEGLKLDGVQVVENTTITTNQIASGKLIYKPTVNIDNIRLLKFHLNNTAIFGNLTLINLCKMIGVVGNVGNISPVFINIYNDNPITFNTTILFTNVNNAQFTSGQVLYEVAATSTEGYLKITSNQTKLIQGTDILEIKIQYNPIPNTFSHSITANILWMDLPINVVVNEAPIITGVLNQLPNRSIYNYMSSYFDLAYTDSNADAMDFIRIYGTNASTRLQIYDSFYDTLTPYTAGEWMQISDFNLRLRYTSEDSDLPYTEHFTWQVKDVFGQISNVANWDIEVAGM